jgi:hypothetical protein
MGELVAILVPLGGMALTFGIIYFVVITRHRERMRLIESGADPALFYNKKQRMGLAIKIGAFLIGIGFGIVAANIQANFGVLDKDVAYPTMILIFGGAGLIAGNHYAKKLEDKDETE